MCASASPFSLITLIPTPRSRRRPILFSPKLILNPRPSRSLSVSAAWTDRAGPEEYGGWAVVENQNKKKTGLPIYLLVGIGTSIVTLLAIFAQPSLSRRGLSIRLGSPLHTLHEILSPSRTEKSVEIDTGANDALSTEAEGLEALPESASDEVVEAITLEKKYSEKQVEKLGCILIPTALDSTQQEALSVLRRLKIIEDDIKADELCTRREFARWLVRANYLLERNPKHRILPPAAVSGSISAAFEDVHVNDPDFEAIQSLAEAGIIRSRLARKVADSNIDDTEYERGIFFFPERFLSRQDLIDWKAQLEYEVFPGMNEKISGSHLGFMDVRDISTDASPEFFLDMLAGDKSILRRVFGQGKRFQPNKPSTKAQAAVALTSGRMSEAVSAEITRLDAEDVLREKEMRVIRFELLEKGDIKRFWEKKLEEERCRASEMERDYLVAVHDLAQESISQEKALSEYTKQRAALDCQRQLLSSLKEEIHEMSKRLTVEKVEYTDEPSIVKDMLCDAQGRLEKAHDAKSILEAEIESLRILRSWIEDEAKKSQARVKVLKEVGSRWKWDDRA